MSSTVLGAENATVNKTGTKPAVMELTFWLDMLTVTNYNFKKLTNMEVFNNKGIWQK